MSEAWDLLSEPFAPGEVQWRIELLSKDQRRALVVPFVDNRIVLDRLDEALGVEGWQDEYTVLSSNAPHFAVKCKLTIMAVSKEDLGQGESLKAAFAAALWQAASKFGMGRYLNAVWVDHDPESGRFEAPLGGVQSVVKLESPVASTPAEPLDPPKPEPQALIDGLMEELKQKGLGKEAARIVTRYGGYGKTIEEMRKVYGELKALLKGMS